MVAFEAAVAGGIPIIKALREGLTANRIEWIAGIINGTTQLHPVRDARQGPGLRRRAEGGAAPGLCRGRPDLRHRGHRRGAQARRITQRASPSASRCSSTRPTSKASPSWMQPTSSYAEQLGYRIKLLGITKRTPEGIELRVHPTLVPDGAPDRQCRGRDERHRGAGRRGRHDAVLRRGRRRRADRLGGDRRPGRRHAAAHRRPGHRVPHLAFQPDAMSDTPILPMEEVVHRVLPAPAVPTSPACWRDITRILAEQQISIDALMQREPDPARARRRPTDHAHPRHASKAG